MDTNTAQPVLYGFLASAFLLGVYFAVLTLVSGSEFAQSQFAQFWYFIVSLALGFGIQVGLYSYLRPRVKIGPSFAKAMAGKHGEERMLGVTGVTSTATMVSCCAHYLVNILPVLGAVGLVTLVAQYQTELFWVGILFNLGGIFYMTKRIFRFHKGLFLAAEGSLL